MHNEILRSLFKLNILWCRLSCFITKSNSVDYSKRSYAMKFNTNTRNNFPFHFKQLQLFRFEKSELNKQEIILFLSTRRKNVLRNKSCTPTMNMKIRFYGFDHDFIFQIKLQQKPRAQVHEQQNGYELNGWLESTQINILIIRTNGFLCFYSRAL